MMNNFDGIQGVWIPFLFGVFWGQRANMVFYFSVGTGVFSLLFLTVLWSKYLFYCNVFK
jgi:hypothetical protein